ncbi:NAD(P)/FAD-dependent oxidoreductase [Actinokineospora cianjurensis]|uniref:D-arginine dehydrogenase n=1 Tax=Actinokineospora cianjurensis TaxID=585224 RepID=A0A421AZN6_9PSEU|nr:FAD-binding oxidoreductase [Actinokineospora cianjurensis]RLK55288.1 D-arginine dehydrogenase [Actinokineospora cianjurensis]
MGYDVVVVGGGMAGVSVAAELAAHRSVVVVEAEAELAWHSTGRSAALYAPSYGGPVVRALTAASAPLFGDGVLSPRPMLWVGEVGGLDGVEELTEAAARELCPVLRPGRFDRFAVDAGTMDIDVMGLHQRYVQRLRAAGGEIRRGAPVTALRRDGQGWRVTAGTEEIVAGTVVNAAGAWVDRIAGLAGVPALGLRPLRRTIAIATGPTPVGQGWPLVADVGDTFYFRPEGPGVLVSPADETPVDPGDAKPDDLDIALAVDRVNEVTTLGLRSVRTAWAGLRTFAPDREPVVGELPDHPGLTFLAGQGGYGIQMAPALAVTAARLILGQPIDTAPELLSPARLLLG